MSDMYVYMYVCMYVCTKSFLKTTTNSLCVCTHLANKADSDSDSDNIRSTQFPRISLYALTLRFVLIEITKVVKPVH